MSSRALPDREPPARSCDSFGAVRGTPPRSRRLTGMQCPVLPQTMMGFVLRCSGRHQIALALLAAGVFGLSSVPLELQRRIVNDAIKNGATETIFWLAAAYAGVALLEQALKFA